MAHVKEATPSLNPETETIPGRPNHAIALALLGLSSAILACGGNWEWSSASMAALEMAFLSGLLIHHVTKGREQSNLTTAVATGLGAGVGFLGGGALPESFMLSLCAPTAIITGAVMLNSLLKRPRK